MPITVRSGLDIKILEIQDRLDTPDLAIAVAAHLASILYENANKDTGAMARALGYVGKPERTATGWKIGVGNPEQIGDRNQPAPRHTLEQFFNYMAGTGRVWRHTDWWGLSQDNKDLLAQARRAGLFGGRGADYANYMWIQNYGNSVSRTPARYFLEQSIAEWRADVPAMVREFGAKK